MVLKGQKKAHVTLYFSFIFYFAQPAAKVTSEGQVGTQVEVWRTMLSEVARRTC